MIRLHSGVAVNPMNVVSVKRDPDNIVVFLWNGRVHKVQTENMKGSFKHIVVTMQRHIDMIAVEPDHYVNVDAIVSIAKVEGGVSINLVTGNRIKLDSVSIDSVYESLMHSIGVNEIAAA